MTPDLRLDADASMVQSTLSTIGRGAFVAFNGSLDFCSGTHIGGWVWDNERPTERIDVEFILDNKVVGQTTANAWRYDLREKGIGDGFHAYWFVSDKPIDPAHVKVRVAASDQTLARNYTAIPLPDDDLMFLVVGGRDGRHFLETGADDLSRIKGLLSIAGVSWQGQKKRVLDWGCGCGRIARHWQKYLDQVEVYGCDINEKLIDWCQKHLSFGSFTVCGLKPPLPFPDAHFDAIYATSVLTHLLLDTQYLWMSEIWRILKPEGIAVLTAHGPSIFPLSVKAMESGNAGRVGLTLLDEEMFFSIEKDEGSNETGNVQTRGAFERIFSPFRILIYKPRHGLMGIQDTYALKKKSQGPLRLISALPDCEMRGVECEGAFDLDLENQGSLTILAGAKGLTVPAMIELSLVLSEQKIAKSGSVILPDKTSWTGLDATYAAVTIDNIPRLQGRAKLRYQVKASQPIENAQLQLRQCALF